MSSHVTGSLQAPHRYKDVLSSWVRLGAGPGFSSMSLAFNSNQNTNPNHNANPNPTADPN